jgi:putative spermidine/putrescine transport system ATP-binding protein
VPYLTLEHLRKSFGPTVALHDMDLVIEKGEFVSFLGPSGCGKTTTLRIIAGFEHADAGRVVVETQDMTHVPPERRGMGMVFQAYGLFPNMTVAQNIGFGLRVAKRPRAEIDARVREMLDLIGMPSVGARYPHQLSGGQQQRVALARAVAIEPRVLLLDEPLSALDAVVRTSLRAEIRAIQQRTGITAIYVTHDQEEALSISDRIVVLDRGRIEQIGTPREIYERPATPFVAAFIGTANRFEGQVLSEAEGLVGIGDRRLMVAPDGSLTGRRNVVVVVRPERISLNRLDLPRRATTTTNVFEGVVRSLTYLGPIDRVQVDVAGQPVIATLPAAESRVLAPGVAVQVHFDAASCHVIAPSGAELGPEGHPAQREDA